LIHQDAGSRDGGGGEFPGGRSSIKSNWKPLDLDSDQCPLTFFLPPRLFLPFELFSPSPPKSFSRSPTRWVLLTLSGLPQNFPPLTGRGWFCTSAGVFDVFLGQTKTPRVLQHPFLYISPKFYPLLRQPLPKGNLSPKTMQTGFPGILFTLLRLFTFFPQISSVTFFFFFFWFPAFGGFNGEWSAQLSFFFFFRLPAFYSLTLVSQIGGTCPWPVPPPVFL